MEVRRNTRTAPAVGRQQFAQAEQTDFRPLLQGAEALQQGLDANRRNRQSFDLQKRLLEESNRLKADLDARRRDPAIDPATFAQTIDSDYTDRVNAVVDEYRAQGYDADLVDDFFAGMGRLRNELGDAALTYQQSALKARSLSAATELLNEASRLVVNDRDQYETALRFYEDTIDLNPDLTDEERVALKDNARVGLRNAAADSWAMEDPAAVLNALDPEGRWRAEREAPVTGSAASVVADTPGTAVGPQQDAIRKAASELGVTPAELAALASYESAGTLNPNIAGGDGGRYVGIFQFGPEEQRRYGVSRNSSFAQQVDALVRFAKDRGYKPGMGWQKLYTTINAGNPNASVNAADSNGTQLDHYRNIMASHMKKAREFLGINDDVVPQGERVPQPGDVVAIDPGAGDTAISEFDTTRDLPTEGELPQPAPELHPVLRDLTGPERLRLMNIADAAVQKNTAQQKAALDVLIDNVKAEALANGEVAAAIPTDEEIMSVYGPVAGPQVISDLRQTVQLGKNMKEFAVMSPDKLQVAVDRLRPQAGSPTFATDNELYEAAKRAQAQILQQRAEDPAAYVMQNFPEVAASAAKGEKYFYPAVDRALESLGINPSTVSPLPKSARDALVKQWPQMPPQARRQWFQQNFLTMGEDRLAAFARGAEGTDMDTERKIFAFSLGSRVTPTTMDEIFAGRDALKKDPSRRPSQEDVTKAFRTSAFAAVTSMNPDASAALQDAAAALYVQKGGRADQFDANVYKEALSQALGGSVPVNLSKGRAGQYTILPPRVSETRFTNWVEQLQRGELTALSKEKRRPVYGDLKTPANLQDIIDDGVFVMVSPGNYIIRMASDGLPLKTETGRTYVVQLRPEDIK